MMVTVGTLLKIVAAVGAIVVAGILLRTYLDWRKEHRP